MNLMQLLAGSARNRKTLQWNKALGKLNLLKSEQGYFFEFFSVQRSLLALSGHLDKTQMKGNRKIWSKAMSIRLNIITEAYVKLTKHVSLKYSLQCERVA